MGLGGPMGMRFSGVILRASGFPGSSSGSNLWYSFYDGARSEATSGRLLAIVVGGAPAVLRSFSILTSQKGGKVGSSMVML